MRCVYSLFACVVFLCCLRCLRSFLTQEFALRALRLFVFACVVLLRCLRNFFTQELALCLALRALRWVETGLEGKAD